MYQVKNSSRYSGLGYWKWPPKLALNDKSAL